MAAPPPAFTPAEKAQIEEIIRGYILEHPEILPEAISLLQKRNAEKGVTANAKRIFEDPDSVVGGNPRGDVTIVEFFDYTCGYCKMMNPALNQLIKSDGKIRFIYKEWPVRGTVADFASHAAIASRLQGKYTQFHDALYAANGQLSEERVINIAKQQGLDITKLKSDMTSPQTNAIIDRNRQLGQEMGFDGTPTFIVGREIIPGAVSLDQMAAAVKRAHLAKK
jgi:protein-disulfide isomerase